MSRISSRFVIVHGNVHDTSTYLPWKSSILQHLTLPSYSTGTELRKSVHVIGSCKPVSEVDEIEQDEVRISIPTKRCTAVCVRHDPGIERGQKRNKSIRRSYLRRNTVCSWCIFRVTDCNSSVNRENDDVQIMVDHIHMVSRRQAT